MLNATISHDADVQWVPAPDGVGFVRQRPQPPRLDETRWQKRNLAEDHAEEKQLKALSLRRAQDDRRSSHDSDASDDPLAWAGQLSARLLDVPMQRLFGSS